MTPPVEVYTAGGIASGTVVPAGAIHAQLEQGGSLQLDNVGWIPIGGPSARAGGRTEIAIDDIVLAHDPGDAELAIHAMWHPVLLDAGPYRIRGELPTLPGFDPGRALTRPSGTFVRLRDVRVELRDRPEAGATERPALFVNRYEVDRVQAGPMLGFFFPGAIIEEARDVEPVDHTSG